MASKKEELRFIITVDDQGSFKVDGLNDKTKKAEEAFEALEKRILKTTTTQRVNINELKKLRNALIQSRDSSALTAKEYRKFSAEIDSVNVRIAEFQTQAKGATKVNGDMQSSAGLAGAATIELGRTVSDAGFGIRGVANNIQQFASLLTTLSVQAGGAGNAFDLIKAQLKGPLGILVAFQGLITVIEVLDRKFNIFSGSVNKLKKSLEDARGEVAESNLVLEANLDLLLESILAESERAGVIDKNTKASIKSKLASEDVAKATEKQLDVALDVITATNNSTLSIGEGATALDRYKKEIDDLVISSYGNVSAEDARKRAIQDLAKVIPNAVDENGNLKMSTEELTTAVNKYIQNQKVRAEIDGLVAGQQELIKDAQDIARIQRELDIAAQEGDFDRMKTLYDENRGFFKKFTDAATAVFDPKNLLQFNETFRAQTSDTIKEYNLLTEKIKLLMKDLFPVEQGDKPDEEDLKTLLETVYGVVPAEKLTKRAELVRDAAREAFLLAIEDKKLRQLMELKLDEEFAIKQLEALDATEADKSVVRERFRLLRRNLVRNENESDLAESAMAASNELKQRSDFQRKAASRLSNYLKKQREKEEEERKKYFDKLKKDIKQSSKFIQGVFDDLLRLRRSTTERELALVDAKTNQLLAKEGLSEKQRIKIAEEAEKQKQKINEKSIVAEMKLTKAKFAIKAAELAANISTDIAEGTLAIKKGTAKTASAGFPGNLPLLIAYGAQAASIIAGMIQAKRQAETALASIGGSAKPVASPTADTITAPDFNVVGQSQASQLSESIAGALGEPVKAYVVSTEIADSLALNRKIENQAFGASGLPSN